jgi:hypothetical protein
MTGDTNILAGSYPTLSGYLTLVGWNASEGPGIFTARSITMNSRLRLAVGLVGGLSFIFCIEAVLIMILVFMYNNMSGRSNFDQARNSAETFLQMEEDALFIVPIDESSYIEASHSKGKITLEVTESHGNTTGVWHVEDSEPFGLDDDDTIRAAIFLQTQEGVQEQEAELANTLKELNIIYAAALQVVIKGGCSCEDQTEI